MSHFFAQRRNGNPLLSLGNARLAFAKSNWFAMMPIKQLPYRSHFQVPSKPNCSTGSEFTAFRRRSAVYAGETDRDTGYFLVGLVGFIGVGRAAAVADLCLHPEPPWHAQSHLPDLPYQH